VVKSDLNPKWEETRLNLEAVCNGDMGRSMKVVVRDHKRGGKHSEMGEFETSMQRFVDSKEEGGDIDEDVAFTLRRNDKKVGNVLVLQAGVLLEQRRDDFVEAPQAQTPSHPRPQTKSPRPEFIDYLTGGCQISLAVAIDFTASNGKSRLLFKVFSTMRSYSGAIQETQEERARLTISIHLNQINGTITRKRYLQWDPFWQSTIAMVLSQLGGLAQSMAQRCGIAFNAETRWKPKESKAL
jgi:hypothetical protein